MPVDLRVECGRSGTSKKLLEEDPEVLLWLRIAEAQHRSIPEAMEANPSSHALLWSVYFERKLKEPEVTHYYLAQIAAEVRRTRAKRPNSVKLEHCIIKFRSRAAAQEGGNIKAMFLAALGLRPDGLPSAGAVQRRARVHVPSEVRRRSGMRRDAPLPNGAQEQRSLSGSVPHRRRTRPDIRLTR